MNEHQLNTAGIRDSIYNAVRQRDVLERIIRWHLQAKWN